MTIVEIGPFTAGEKPAPIEYQFLDSAGVPLNIAAYAARFTYSRIGGTPTTGAGTCTVTDAANGKVTYTWQATDLATAGAFVAEMWVGNGTNKFASVRLVYRVFASAGPVPSI